MSFKNKVVIVTGASSGIGAEIARVFASESAMLAIVGRNADRLNKTAEECEKISGGKSLQIIADVANDDQAKGIIGKTIDEYKKIDVLINNAGVYKFKSILSEDFIETFDEIIAVNLRATAVLMKEAAPYLIETKGNIVNISSIASTSPMEGGSSYGAAKAGLDHLTRCVALDLAPKGVRVNTVNPGPTVTKEQNFQEMASLSSAEMMEKIRITMANIIPLEAPADASEVAEMVIYLASDKAKSITGASYTIDSGCLLKGISSLGVLFQNASI